MNALYSPEEIDGGAEFDLSYEWDERSGQQGQGAFDVAQLHASRAIIDLRLEPPAVVEPLDLGDTMESLSPFEAGDGMDVSFAPISYISRDALLLHFLGEDGLGRLAEFRKYEHNWDADGGMPLDPVSEEVLIYFLAVFSDFPTHPSIFLTRSGNLQLAWEDDAGSEIEIDFYPDHVEMLLFESGLEFSGSVEEAARLLR